LLKGYQAQLSSPRRMAYIEAKY